MSELALATIDRFENEVLSKAPDEVTKIYVGLLKAKQQLALALYADAYKTIKGVKGQLAKAEKKKVDEMTLLHFFWVIVASKVYSLQ